MPNKHHYICMLLSFGHAQMKKMLFGRNLNVVCRKVETSPTFSQIPLAILLTRFQIKMASEQQNNLVQQISLAGIDFKALLRQVSMANEDPEAVLTLVVQISRPLLAMQEIYQIQVLGKKVGLS